MRWWILPVGVLTLALAWIVGVRVLLLLSGPPRQDFGAQIRGMTRPGSGMRLVGVDPLDSTYHMLRAASGDTVLASPEDFRHQRLRVRTHDGREGVWYLEGTPDLFGHRLPPGDEDVVIQGGGLDNAPRWVPHYPGVREQPGLVSRMRGEILGGWAFETPDSLAQVERFYRAAFRDSGFTVGTEVVSGGGGARSSVTRVQTADQRRQAIVELHPSPHRTTRAQVDWRQKL